jgi:hypothetical protein
MNRYAITEKAGRFVAGQTNTGVGTVLTLTAKQAEHELRLGTLRALDGRGSTSETANDRPAPLPAKAEPKPNAKGKTRGGVSERQGV